MTYRILTFTIAAIVLFACKGPTKTTGNAINVSIEPQKYLIDKISGGKYQVNVVVKTGQNHETYEPTPQQMVQLEQSSLYLMIAKDGFDRTWASNLKERNPQMAVVDLSEGIVALEADHECSADHDHHHGTDPHLWVSPSTIKTIAYNTYRALRQNFVADSAMLDNGYQLLVAEIDNIDSLYKTRLQPYSGKAFMVYHPVLGYVARDYGLAQLPIEMEGKEPSVEDIKQLIEAAKAQNIKLIFIQKEFDTRNAALIANETNAHIETLNPLNYNWADEAKQTLDKLTKAFDQP